MSIEHFEVRFAQIPPPSVIPIETRGLVSSAVVARSNHLVSLFDDEGRIGSGLLVRLSDGRHAVLTARHVVLDLAIAGAFHIIVPDLGWCSVEPLALQIAPRNDLALVHLGELVIPGPVPELTFGDPGPAASLTAVGTPAKWKGEVDAQARVLHGLRGLAVSANQVGSAAASLARMELDVDWVQDVESFEGMSGGPVFTSEGELAGVVTHQSVERPRRLHCAPISQALALVEAASLFSAGRGFDFRQCDAAVVPARFRRSQVYIVGLFEHFWNLDVERRPVDFVSRLMGLACAGDIGSLRYVMNTESIFLPDGKDWETHLVECRAELALLLDNTSLIPLVTAPRVPDWITLAMMDLLRQVSGQTQLTLVLPEDTEVDG